MCTPRRLDDKRSRSTCRGATTRLGSAVTRYTWDFGDGASATSTTPTTTHTYASEGTFTASLVVTDSRDAASAPATVQVESGEHAPTLDVTGIAPSYAVGDPILLELAATDAEDGILPASSITWELRRRHANHSHPYVDPTTGDTVSAAYPGPEDLQAAGESRLLLVATATDSAGLSVTARRVLRPRRVELTFRTDPGGGRIVLQGAPVTVPVRVVSWAGFRFPVSAPDQRFGGTRHVFRRWSDGGARAQRPRHTGPTHDVRRDVSGRRRVMEPCCHPTAPLNRHASGLDRALRFAQRSDKGDGLAIPGGA